MMNITETLFAKWTNSTPQKDFYLNQLHQGGVWTVEFTKVDGTPAVMDVTLDPIFMPPPATVDPTKPLREEKEHLIHAYSTDRQGWRSFTVANVKSFKPKA